MERNEPVSEYFAAGPETLNVNDTENAFEAFQNGGITRTPSSLATSAENRHV